MKKIAIIILLSTFIGCQNSENVESSNRLTDQSLAKFNQIFGDIPFNGITYNFTSVETFNPNFNWDIITKEDTANFSFFLMKSDSFDLKVAVNNHLCFASIITTDRGFDYPNHFTLHPNDFSWLNKEKLGINYNCINKDELKYREVSYDKNLLGKWLVDSTFNNEGNENISNFEFLDSLIIINDSTSYRYEQSGYYLETTNPEKYIYKIFVNKSNMIFYNNLNENLVTYYCRKKK